MDKRTTEKEEISLFILSCQIVVALQRTGIVHFCPDCGDRFVCRFARALQFIRKDCKQPVCARIPLGEQPARLRCRTGRQLCLLRNGRVDEKPADVCHCRAHPYTICPVGTILGFLSRFSLLRITIDTDKCNACGLCSRKCKAACISGKEHTVDYSRCVACMDCIDTCRHGAISLKPLRPLKPLQTSPEGEASKIEAPNSPSGGVEGASRRSFLSATAVLAVTSAIHAQEKKVDGGLAVIEDKKVPKRATPIVPSRTRRYPNVPHRLFRPEP